MLFYLLLLFVSVPLVELVILLRLAELITAWATILLVVATGVVGAALARRQGWRTYVRIRQELASGRMPTQSLLDAALIFVAGALLVTPGILTDLFGFSLLVPGCRRFYCERASRWVRARFHVQTFRPEDAAPGRDEVIEGHVVRERNDHDRDRGTPSDDSP